MHALEISLQPNYM